MTSVQYVYIFLLPFYHMHRFMQPPSQPRDRASMLQRWRTFVVTPFSFSLPLANSYFPSLYLFIFIILRMLHKRNHSVWDLLWNQFFFTWYNALESHSSCCIHACMHAKSLQLCPTLCNPMDRIPTGSSVHGILHARILEWVAMPSFRGSSWSRDQNCISFVSCIGWWVLYH